MNRRIAVVTGSRSEYGLLRWLMRDIAAHDALDLYVLVTGAHLSPEHGLTVREIEEDGFTIHRRIDTLLSSDSAQGIGKSMGLGVIGFAGAFAELRPDVLVVLGDRYEIFAAVAAAAVANIPVAHLHGGEVTLGAYDEGLRHAMTKLSHLHFVATAEYRARVVQLGEDPQHVYLVGGLGVDAIRRTTLLTKTEVETQLGIALREPTLMVAFHPVTLEEEAGERELIELLAALDSCPDAQCIITMPNADTGGRSMATRIHAFAATRPHVLVVPSLEQRLYFSTLALATALVGNSSSGLLEAPSFGKPTVNVGDRQHGRQKAESVIDCRPTRAAIGAAIRRACAPEFQHRCASVRNPYGDGGASQRVTDVLAGVSLLGLLKKRFHSTGVDTVSSPIRGRQRGEDGATGPINAHGGD